MFRLYGYGNAAIDADAGKLFDKLATLQVAEFDSSSANLNTIRLKHIAGYNDSSSFNWQVDGFGAGAGRHEVKRRAVYGACVEAFPNLCGDRLRGSMSLSSSF